MKVSRRSLVTGAAALAMFDAVKARGQQVQLPGLIPGRRAGFQFIGSYPSFVPPTTLGRPTLSYYKFTTDQGYSGGTVQPSSTSDFTCSRASVGYDLAATTLFSANQFRRTTAGLLVEVAATNVLPRSTSIGVSPWGVASTGGPTPPVITTNFTNAPDGQLTALKIVLPAVSVANSYSVVYPGNVTLTSAPWVYYMWLKGDLGGETGYITANINTPAFFTTQYTLSTQWQRFAVSFTGTASNFWTCLIGPDLRDTNETAKSAQTIYAWGGQVALGPASSLIPTTTTSATRAADAISCTIPPGASQALFTFDDASTQTVSVSPGAYTIPTNLNRSLIASMGVS